MFLRNFFAKLYSFKEKLLKKAIDYQRKDAGLILRHLNLSFGEIAYMENSVESHTTIVLLHGFGGDKDNWNLFVKQLRDKYHVVVLDLLGHGTTCKSNKKNYSIDNQVKMLSDFLMEKNLNNIHLVGNSMGGAIALKFCAENPMIVKTLTLVDPLGLKKSDSELDLEIIQSGNNPMLNICTKDSFKKLLSYGMEKPPYIPGIFLDIIVKEKCSRKELEEIIFKQIYENNDLVTAAQNIDTKALILWGKKDRVLHIDNAELFHKNIKNSTLVVFENVGHVPQLEAPEITAKAFLNFIENQ